MKVSQGDERPVVRALQFRAGTTHLRHLMDGEVGTRGNFMLGIWKSEGDFFSVPPSVRDVPNVEFAA